MSAKEIAEMEEFLDETISENCLHYFEKKYHLELESDGMVARDGKFEYAFCLIHSKYGNDVRRGVRLMEELYATICIDRINFLYFAAYGHARLQNYSEGLQMCKTFLEYRENRQVRKLQQYLQKRYNEKIIKRTALVSSVAMVAGGLFSFGMGLLRQ